MVKMSRVCEWHHLKKPCLQRVIGWLGVQVCGETEVVQVQRRIALSLASSNRDTHSLSSLVSELTSCDEWVETVWNLLANQTTSFLQPKS